MPSRRAKASIAALSTLASVAALAPTPAAATVNVDRCQPTGIPNVGTNSHGFCSLETSGSGSTGEPIIGEPIRVFGFLPKPLQPLPKPPASDPITACAKRLGDCLPGQVGGRDLEAKDGDRGSPGPGGPRAGGGKGSAQKGETKGKRKPPTKAQCEKAENGSGLSTLPELDARLRQLEKEEKKLSQKLDGPFKTFWELNDEAISKGREAARLERLRRNKNAEPSESLRNDERIRSLRSEVRALESQMEAIQAETRSIFVKLDEVEAKRKAIEEKSHEAWAQLIDRCRDSGQT